MSKDKKNLSVVKAERDSSLDDLIRRQELEKSRQAVKQQQEVVERKQRMLKDIAATQLLQIESRKRREIEIGRLEKSKEENAV